MNETVMVLVSGEALANGYGSNISSQHKNAKALAEGLKPILNSDLNVMVVHGNKPQVGFVLFRAELASHVLHAIPLDVCGADTQGATGYMLTQEFINVLQRQGSDRQVIGILTQSLVDTDIPKDSISLRAIGPAFDRDKADNYRQMRKWSIIEEPGIGYRRGVPSYPVKQVIEIENIKKLVAEGNVVVGCGGGGIPVIRNAQGDLEGIEAVVESEQLVPIIAEEIGAKTLLIVVANDRKFILAGLNIQTSLHLSTADLKKINEAAAIQSYSVQRSLKAADEFLANGGEQVIISTLHSLPEVFKQGKGLWIGKSENSFQELLSSK